MNLIEYRDSLFREDPEMEAVKKSIEVEEIRKTPYFSIIKTPLRTFLPEGYSSDTFDK